jgi:thiosulfate dehydrogenase [quinone] large subunit
MVPASPSRSIAFARIVTGVMFLCEGYGKITGSFLHGGFAKNAAQMAKEGFPFWRPILEKLVLPHPSPFGWAIALGELAIGLSLVFGFLVRWACACGILMMLVIGLGGSWPAAGAHGNQYVTAWLTQAAYAMLFLIFASADAGKLWGLDARRRGRR